MPVGICGVTDVKPNSWLAITEVAGTYRILQWHVYIPEGSDVIEWSNVLYVDVALPTAVPIVFDEYPIWSKDKSSLGA